MKRLIIHMASLALLCITVSCQHKELCYHHPHTARVRIDVDWSEFEKDEPSGMTVMVYPLRGGVAITHLTNTTTHAYVDLLAGSYHSIVFNQSESEYGSVLFKGMDRYETAEVYTATSKSGWYKSKSGEEKVATDPEWIGTDTYENSVVTEEMVSVTGEHLIMEGNTRAMPDYVIANHIPQNIIYTLTVKVHVKGYHNLRSARASMNGLAEGYMFAAHKPTSAIVTQLMENWSKQVDEVDPTKGTITGQITCFGLPDGHRATSEENLFNLSLLLVDNKTVVTFPFNVGDLIVCDKDRLELWLELDLDEPLPDVQPEGGSGSGFDATVDDWGDEENFEVEL